MASSSLLLGLSIFLAVSSVGKAWFFDYGYYYPPPDAEEKPAECDDVSNYFPACQEYLSGDEDSPSSTCCSNLETLKSIAEEEGPRRICQCIEDLKAPFVESRIEEIYKQCDIHLNFPISEHMDCSSV